jgi:ubiquinone/menaquinone biosynthesis C-methylase UbiE
MTPIINKINLVLMGVLIIFVINLDSRKIMELRDNKKNDYQIWQNETLVKTFLSGVRSAVPLAETQIEIIIRLINLTQKQVTNFLDLGCGNGILGKAISHSYPKAKGVFLDFSEDMLTAAKNNIKLEQHQFIKSDFAERNWVYSVEKYAPFDVIISGFAIHHQPDDRKKEIYQEIYSLLSKGGIFLNLEHILSHSKLGETAFNDLFIDSLFNYHKQQNSVKSREEIATEFYHRDDKKANILTSVETQCQWLREIGFQDVDCYFKILEIAIFGGVKK